MIFYGHIKNELTTILFYCALQPCAVPPSIRYAQALTLELPATGMASCHDLGDPDPHNINGLCHSRYKTECGRRLALEVNRLLPAPVLAPSPGPAPAPIPVSRGPTPTSVALTPDRTSRSKVSSLPGNPACQHAISEGYPHTPHGGKAYNNF